MLVAVPELTVIVMSSVQVVVPSVIVALYVVVVVGVTIAVAVSVVDVAIVAPEVRFVIVIVEERGDAIITLSNPQLSEPELVTFA